MINRTNISLIKLIYSSTQYILILILLSSCGNGSGFSGCPSIKDIYDNPDEFQGKEVCLEGIAQNGTNLCIIKFYDQHDATGVIIVTPPGAVPNDGKKKKIYGRVNQYLKIPGKGSIIAIEAIE